MLYDERRNVRCAVIVAFAFAYAYAYAVVVVVVIALKSLAYIILYGLVNCVDVRVVHQ